MSRNAFILILISLVAALAIGFVMGRGTAPHATDGIDPLATDPGREEPRAPASLPPSPATSATLEQAIAAIPKPEREAGDGELTGRVTTRDGTPLSDVEIIAQRATRVSRAGFDRDESIATRVSRMVHDDLFRKAHRWVTHTGADGTYRIPGLPADHYAVFAKRRAYRIRAVGKHLVETGASVDFSAHALAEVEVVVLLPDGTEAKTAWVLAHRGDRPVQHTVTPDDRTLTLEPGVWALAALGPDEDTKSPEQEVALKAGEPAPRVTLTLRTRPGIRGRITAEDGVEVTFTLAVSRLPESGRVDLRALEEPLITLEPWRMRHGEYRLTDLAPGSYLLGVRVQNKTVVHAVVAVTDRMATRDLVIPPPAASEVVHVRVLGPEGEDLPSARVTTAYRSDSSSSRGASPVTRLRDGRWRVHHHRPRPEIAGENERWFIEVHSKTLGPKRVEYVPGEQSEITVRFDAPTSLRLRLSGYEASGCAGELRVRLRPSTGGEDLESQGGIDADGIARFGPVQPGAHEVRILHKSGRAFPIEIALAPLDLEGGAISRTIRLPRLHTLTVLVDVGDRDASLWLTHETRPRPGVTMNRHRTDRTKPRDGKVVFRGLVDGTYQVCGPRGNVKVLLPGPNVVRYAP